MKRQRNGTGTIAERPGRSGSYRGQVMVEGRRISVYGKSLEEVQAKLDEAKIRAKSGQPPRDGLLTVARYVESWIANTPGKRIAPMTKLRYEQILRKHVTPVIGHLKLASLQPEDVDRVLKRMRDPRPGRPDGYHGTTIVHVHATMQRVLRDAKRARKITENVATAEWIDVEHPARREQMPILPADRQKLLNAVKDDRLGPLYLLAFMTGARLGELCGLRWADVDFDAGLIRIEQTVGRVGRETMFKGPKNDASIRTVSMNGPIRAVLIDQRRRQEWGLTGDASKGLGHPHHKDDPAFSCFGFMGSHAHGPLAFTSLSGGPLQGSYVTMHLQKILAAAGLPRIRFHDARHSFVSWAAAEGVDVDTISKIVGHSSTAVTRNVYLTIFQERKVAAMDKLADLFDGIG